MSERTTRVYKNTTKDELNVPGIGIIEPGQQISLTTEHQPVVFLENHPGLVDVLAEEQAAADKAAEKANKAKEAQND